MLQALPTAEQVDRALQEVYSRPEFAVRPQHSFWEAVLRPLGRFLRWLGEQLGRFDALEASAPWLYWLILGWLAVSAIAIVGHLLWTALSGVRWREKRAVEEGAAVAAGRGPRTAGDWEAEARRAAAEGRMREAAVALYHALLLRLDARGAVRFDPAKTPGDYRREVRRHPELATPFVTFLRGFEPVVFGGRTLDSSGYERLRAAAGEAGARG